MKKISKYQLFTELQQGPITRIYKAIQSELQRIVLVKQLNPDLIMDADLVERFKQEGLILAKINSPHVITIFDFGVDDGVPFLVTEFVEGTTLSELIEKSGALPWDISLLVLQQISLGLKAIHQQRIIHQDIKPENIFISHQGEVKLGDLGFSTSQEQVDQQIQGTPAYLPPEVIEGAPVDFRSDLYSLGLVGYEMLTGENPFAATDMQTVFNRIVNLKPMQVHAVRSEVPAELAAIISKLMARNPDERFPSARDLYQELENFKISKGIKVDTNTVISFLQEPDKHHISQFIPGEKIAQSVTKPKKRKRALLSVGLVILGIIIILLVKQLNDGFSFFRKKNDKKPINSEQNFSQEENYQQIPIATNEVENKKEPATKIRRKDLKAPIQSDVIKDTLTIPIETELKIDTIVITSDPRAVVFQNGDSLGITPFPLYVDSGKENYELEFRTPGFPAIKKIVTIVGQDVQNIHINLWQEVGYLDISIMPWGEIWIDGDSIDVSPINRPILLIQGKHKLTVRHPFLKNVTETFYAAAGETVKKHIFLQKRP